MNESSAVLDMPSSFTPAKVCNSRFCDATAAVLGRYTVSPTTEWVPLNVHGFGKLPPGSVLIRSLDSPSVTIINAIPVQIEIEDGVFVASFVEANINASGETKDKAIEMLKDMIAWTYQLLCQKESALGQQPQRQLAVLRRFVRE